MRTADWTTYVGPGRVALAPVPAGIARGYRLGPKSLWVRKPPLAPEVRTKLATLDPAGTWAALHLGTYPNEPVLCASGFDVGWRDEVAAWLRLWGYPVSELDPATYRPQRTHPRVWRRPPSVATKSGISQI